VTTKPGLTGDREASRQTIAQGRPMQTAYLLRLKLVCFFILPAERANACRHIVGKIRNGKMPTSSAPLRQAGSLGIGGGKRIVVADDFAES
jgi:hypothetical protein